MNRSGSIPALVALCAFSLGAGLITTNKALAEPGDTCETRSDCDDGERCSQGVCKLKRQPKADAGPSQDQSQGQTPGPSGGHQCCDAFGNARCSISNGPLPMGSSCFCYGQGYGLICK
jgi:hypothetical protein